MELWANLVVLVLSMLFLAPEAQVQGLALVPAGEGGSIPNHYHPRLEAVSVARDES